MLKKKKDNYKAFTHFRIDYDSMVAPACRHDFSEDDTKVTSDIMKVTCDTCKELALSLCTSEIFSKIVKLPNEEIH